MSKTTSEKKNVVIVGAGYSGTAVASGLSAKLDAENYNVILINPRSFAISLPVCVRIVVSGEQKLEETSFVPLDRLYTNDNGETKVGVVSRIEQAEDGEGAVLLTSGERVPYAVLVLASGSLWNGPMNIPLPEDEVMPHVHLWRKKFEQAQNIVLVGGGAVGVELAGELRDTHPTKKITIVHGGSQLLNPTYPTKMCQGLEERLRTRNVELLFNEYIDEIPAEGTIGVITRSGKVLQNADLVVNTRGPRPNTEFITSIGGDTLNGQGFVKVKSTFQLLAHENIFAAGDIIEWNEQKQAAKTKAHSEVVIANVLSYLADAPTTKEYKGSTEVIIVSVGKNGGMAYFGYFGGFTLGDWFAKLIKSKNMMVPMWRKWLGY
ncbi:hypothetical protein SERLADRAFT_444609 [Serpula lacrymans var. lacrymans S7.9]|uniref:FAD/NAD(P)-binding domain-containing protein n=1 Tax=Serpula lacrymans var. lacrymans (strain S7.9) TaxID=578457 RepID=F8NG67_SERL9|nr:uncharacterized protein SERLADRAFT_444609 [Serpula lacrymans var. lacrymans S7.9]EGO31037.1 hypothetical protein SERLADRAFT_444609 [Serpula lacrymans var. lacrymans S7.9]